MGHFGLSLSLESESEVMDASSEADSNAHHIICVSKLSLRRLNENYIYKEVYVINSVQLIEIYLSVHYCFC